MAFQVGDGPGVGTEPAETEPHTREGSHRATRKVTSVSTGKAPPSLLGHGASVTTSRVYTTAKPGQQERERLLVHHHLDLLCEWPRQSYGTHLRQAVGSGVGGVQKREHHLLYLQSQCSAEQHWNRISLHLCGSRASSRELCAQKHIPRTCNLGEHGPRVVSTAAPCRICFVRSGSVLGHEGSASSGPL